MLAGKINSIDVILEGVAYALYTIPSDQSQAYAVLDLNICNRNYTAVSVRIYVVSNDVVYDIEPNIELQGLGVFLRTAITVSPGDTIYLLSSAPNVNAVLYGSQFNYDTIADVPLPEIPLENLLDNDNPIANDQFGERTYANNIHYFVKSADGVDMFDIASESKLTTFTNPGSANNGFGEAIAASDFFVFISAPDETASPVANGTGVVYVFSSISYDLQTTMANLNTTQTIYGTLGTCLESNNDYLLIGDSGGGVTADTGIILVYDSETRNPIGELTADSLLDSGDGLGINVSLDDSFVVAGVPNANKVLTFSAASQTLGVEITAPAGATQFGYSADTQNNIIVVGDPTVQVGDALNAGAAWAYDTNGNLLFELESPVGLLDNDQFGYAVAVSANNILVGAPGYNDDEGIVYTYTFAGQFVAAVSS